MRIGHTQLLPANPWHYWYIILLGECSIVLSFQCVRLFKCNFPLSSFCAQNNNVSQTSPITFFRWKCVRMYLPIKQSINQSINQSFNQSINQSIHWHEQNVVIPCRSQEPPPFLPIIHFFLPFLSANHSSILPHFIQPSLTFHVLIFIFLFQIHSSSVIPSFRGSFEKFVSIYFLLTFMQALKNLL